MSAWAGLALPEAGGDWDGRAWAAGETTPSAAVRPTVALWQPFELAFPGPAGALPVTRHKADRPGPASTASAASSAAMANVNPFVDIRFTVRFYQEEGTKEVLGYYDGAGVYRVRFLPARPGLWHYTTVSSHPLLEGIEGDFLVTPTPAASAHGPVTVVAGQRFVHADGTPCRPLGIGWPASLPPAREAAVVRSLAASPFNKVRVPIWPALPEGGASGSAGAWPFPGGPRQPDVTRFDPKYFARLEHRVTELGKAGLEVELAFAAPDADAPGPLDGLSGEDRERVLRYVVARFAGFPNVWWSFGAARTGKVNGQTGPGLSEAERDRLGNLLAAEDVYHHPRSEWRAHDLPPGPAAAPPWASHVSVVGGVGSDALTTPAALHRPLVVVETVAGSSPLGAPPTAGPGAPSESEAFVGRIWNDRMRGADVDVDCTGPSRDGALSWSATGALAGKALPRLAFLRRIWDDLPALAPGPAGPEPVQGWPTPKGRGLALPPRLYLGFFDQGAPTSWAFVLPSLPAAAGAPPADGTPFGVEIVDPWNMTVTPGSEPFIVKKSAAGTLGEATGRLLPLPGRPGLVLRIRPRGP